MKPMSFSAYRKLIKQGLADIGISLNYGPYSLKHATIDKLFRLGLSLPQICKHGRYALNSTMPLLHYNPTSTNVKAVTLLSTKEGSDPTSLQSESKSTVLVDNSKEYLDFFGEDIEIERIVKEISQKEKENNDSETKEKTLQQIQDLKKQLININDPKPKKGSVTFKIVITDRLKEILKQDQKLKRKLKDSSHDPEVEKPPPASPK
jgi:hypothetical protein